MLLFYDMFFSKKKIFVESYDEQCVWCSECSLFLFDNFYITSLRIMWSPDLFSFLSSQRLCVVATHAWDEIRTSNVFYGIDESYTFYFISNEETKHSKHILQNPSVAFSIARYDPTNHMDRKSVQCSWSCKKATTLDQITTWVTLHNTHYPEFAERITVDWALSEENKSHVWTITPTYIKFWNDELYWINGTEEFTF